MRWLWMKVYESDFEYLCCVMYPTLILWNDDDPRNILQFCFFFDIFSRTKDKVIYTRETV